MKLINVVLQIIKWIFATCIVLFSLATLMAKSYAQTSTLILLVIFLIYWPIYFKNRFGKHVSMISRIVIIAVLFSLNFTVFSPEPKTTIYTSEQNKQKLIELYNTKQAYWPEGTKDIYLQTKYGEVHVLSCGSPENPPLVMLHAASMGAHSWAENLEPLINDFCIYAFDNIGEGNKSQLSDALVFPQTGEEIADLYAGLLDSLQIKRSPVLGASNGGYIAQVLAYYYPEKVESLSLFGPMGLTQLSNGSIFMMSIGSMYPFRFVRKAVTHWAIGNDEYCNQKYGDWFDCIIKGTIPSLAKPVPMTTEQKKTMTMPVLLFLGTEDPIVGDAETARNKALDYPNIQIEVLESGHLVAVEHWEFINNKIVSFLNRQDS